MRTSMLLPWALATLAVAKVAFLGVSMAGGEFGCEINGNCPVGMSELPSIARGESDVPGQMAHFVHDDQINMFRLSVSWQFLGDNQFQAPLSAPKLALYDKVMQACLDTGAHCIIDIHNFARWNGAIIGQSGAAGPTDDDFAALWSQLATRYAAAPNVVFELMNEPHDVDVKLWAATCQKAVAAIRAAGATTHMILLPGNNFDSAATLVASGSLDALLAVRNPDGSADNLLLDVHKYLDTDNSGTHVVCTTDNVDAFANVATALRAAGRKALVSETGASADASCVTAFCAQNTFINANADVFVGLVVWAAGSFAPDYVLGLTPTKTGTTYVDKPLLKQCVLDTWNNSPLSPPPTISMSPKPSASMPSPSSPPVPSTPMPSSPSGPPNDANKSMPTVSPSGMLDLPVPPKTPTGTRNTTTTPTSSTVQPTSSTGNAWDLKALAQSAALSAVALAVLLLE